MKKGVGKARLVDAEGLDIKWPRLERAFQKATVSRRCVCGNASGLCKDRGSGNGKKAKHKFYAFLV